MRLKLEDCARRGIRMNLSLREYRDLGATGAVFQFLIPLDLAMLNPVGGW
jgi:hypothetical protein